MCTTEALTYHNEKSDTPMRTENLFKCHGLGLLPRNDVYDYQSNRIPHETKLEIEYGYVWHEHTMTSFSAAAAAE